MVCGLGVLRHRRHRLDCHQVEAMAGAGMSKASPKSLAIIKAVSIKRADALKRLAEK